jgi:hypothetical protein
MKTPSYKMILAVLSLALLSVGSSYASIDCSGGSTTTTGCTTYCTTYPTVDCTYTSSSCSNNTPPPTPNSQSAVPEPSTIVAGALLLLPFGISTVRILRKDKNA